MLSNLPVAPVCAAFNHGIGKGVITLLRAATDWIKRDADYLLDENRTYDGQHEPWDTFK